MDLTRDQIRFMIYYDYKKELSQQECLESLKKTFGDSCVSRATVNYQFAQFNHDGDHFKDEPYFDQLRTAVTLENLEAVHQLVVVNPHNAY